MKDMLFHFGAKSMIPGSAFVLEHVSAWRQSTVSSSSSFAGTESHDLRMCVSFSDMRVAVTLVMALFPVTWSSRRGIPEVAELHGGTASFKWSFIFHIEAHSFQVSYSGPRKNWNSNCLSGNLSQFKQN